MTDDDKIAELKAEVDRLKAKITPPAYDDAAMREWQNEMHQIRERRASQIHYQSRDQLRAMDAACSPADIRDIVQHGTIPSRSAAGTSGQVTKYSSSPGIPGSNTTGWIEPRPLSNPPGINYVDALCEVDAARQRGERMVADTSPQPWSGCPVA